MQYRYVKLNVLLTRSNSWYVTYDIRVFNNACEGNLHTKQFGSKASLLEAVAPFSPYVATCLR